METLDIILILPILYGAYSGYQKGLLIEIIGVAAFIVALIIGFKMLGFGMNIISPYIGEQLSNRFLPYLSFSIIFFPTIFLINRFGWMLRKALRYTVLGTIDGFAGAVVGIFTWVFGISTLFWLMSSVQYSIPKKYIEKSLVYEKIKPVAPQIISKLSDLIPIGGNFIKEFKDKNLKNSQ